ncbi:MAG: hypothetical protein HZC24_01375 [Rhodocyclales bacterium]|nr:hypothetical protein [Rhodocyclales bacterium]
MSVLSRNELRVVLCPSHAALLAIEHRFTRRGIRHELKGQEIVAGDGGDAKGTAKRRYDRALAALEAALPAYARPQTAATLIISNHFSRYLLVPWSEELAGDDERLAFAQHRFRELYGDVANQWELRLSPTRDGAPQLSSAVDRRLLTAMRDIFARKGVAIASIQPHLMAAYNGAFPLLQKRSAWLGLVEPGMLFLALLQKGQWVRLRSLRIGDDWHEELPQLLEREACLAGAAGAIDEVLLALPDGIERSLPADGRWRFRRLHAVAAPGELPGGEWGFAMRGQR